MTALSIPERAREIAELENETVASIMAALCVAFDIPLPKLNAPALAVKALVHEKLTLKLLHSERELCAKELEARAAEAREEVAEYRKEGMTDGYLIHAAVNEVENYTNAAKLLREGGQK